MEPFLRATDVIDWSEPNVLGRARSLAAGRRDPSEVSRICFEWVRDEIRHCVDYGRDELTCTASEVLRAGTRFCYAKSHLLVALLRANGVPAGLCYQRLAHDRAGTAFVLHGLAAVRLPELGWYRVDPRGNKPGVNAQFSPPAEQLAFATALPGEFLFAGVSPDPAPPVLAALRSGVGAQSLRGRLPDPKTDDELWGAWALAPVQDGKASRVTNLPRWRRASVRPAGSSRGFRRCTQGLGG
jgi:transglutaminase-like putative cysteine protease